MHLSTIEIYPTQQTNMKKIVPVLTLFLFCTSVYSNSFESFKQGGYEYFYYSDTSVVISDVALETPIPVSSDSTLVIPSSVEFEGKTYHVDGIGKGAFFCRSEIKHLVICEGVRYIGSQTFGDCANLVSVHLPSTFECIECIEDGFFPGCNQLCSITVDKRNEELDSRDGCNAIVRTLDNTLIFGCQGTNIPSSVTTIGPCAFRFCQNLTQITIPEGVKRIEYFAFKDCNKLKRINFPNSLDSIGSHVFDNCMSLDSITIPKNVKTIAGGVFSGCYNLKVVKVNKENHIFDSRNNCNAIIDSAQDTIVAGCGTSKILNGIKGIGAFAFAETSIPKIEIPKSVRKIGDRAFSGCRFCNAICVDSKNPIFNSKNNCNAIIETATGKLIQGCGVTSIPDNVKEIGDFAFCLIPMPPHIVIPEGVEVIGSHAFSWFNNIELVRLPSTLKRIKTNAFGSCDRLYYVDLSKCSANIDEFAFVDCSSLHFVDLSTTPGEINKLAFGNCPVNEKIKYLLEKNRRKQKE